MTGLKSVYHVLTFAQKELPFVWTSILKFAIIVLMIAECQYPYTNILWKKRK